MDLFQEESFHLFFEKGFKRTIFEEYIFSYPQSGPFYAVWKVSIASLSEAIEFPLPVQNEQEKKKKQVKVPVRQVETLQEQNPKQKQGEEIPIQVSKI